jgi:calcium-dependent protein kinase
MENHSADAQVKVIDFGNAVRYRGQTPLTKVVGTTYTAAPEVFRKQYDERCDVWSLGVVTYILLSGRRPFERVEIAQNVKSKESSVIASILMGRYHFRHEIWQTISTDAISFVRACLEMHYQRRAYPVELLNHPWITKNRESNAGLASYSAFARNTMINLSARGMGRSNMSASNVSLLGLESQLSSPHLGNFATAAATGGVNADSMKGSGCILGSGTSANHLISGNNSEKASPMMNSDFVLNAAPTSSKIQQPFHSSIQQTSMLAVAFAMPISRARQLRDLFQQIDHNNNGTIDQEEFRVAFQQFHPEMTLADIDLLFNVIDQDDNKAISFLEFVAATIDPREVDIREINQVSVFVFGMT